MSSHMTTATHHPAHDTSFDFDAPLAPSNTGDHLVTEDQVEVYDETSRTWLVFDHADDADAYSLDGDEDLVAFVVPADEPPVLD